MPPKFDLALSKATFLNIKCETRVFDDLQKLFQFHQKLIKLTRVHGNIIHKRGCDISYRMQNLLDSSDKSVHTALLTKWSLRVLVESTIPNKSR